MTCHSRRCEEGGKAFRLSCVHMRGAELFLAIIRHTAIFKQRGAQFLLHFYQLRSQKVSFLGSLHHLVTKHSHQNDKMTATHLWWHTLLGKTSGRGSLILGTGRVTVCASIFFFFFFSQLKSVEWIALPKHKFMNICNSMCICSLFILQLWCSAAGHEGCIPSHDSCI